MEKKLQKIYPTYYNLLISQHLSFFSNVVNNLSEEIHKTKCKHGHNDENCITCGIKYKSCDYFREYTNFRDNIIEYKCLCCTKNYPQKFDEKLKERFLNIYKFSNHDKNKFVLLLPIGA